MKNNVHILLFAILVVVNTQLKGQIGLRGYTL